MTLRISNGILLVLASLGVPACAPHVTIADAGDGGEGGNVVTGSGGIAGMSSIGGGTPSGGAAAVGGTDGVGAFGGTGAGAGSGLPSRCMQPIDTSTLGCDAEAMLRTHCARGGCHNAATSSAELDLTMDSLLAARLLDVPARLTITQPGGGPCIPAKCPPRGSTMLLDTTSPADSWIFRKMEAFDVEMPSTVSDMGCGTAMPFPPGNAGFTSERRVCLQALFLRIIETAVPCTFPREPLPELPMCPEDG